jgi:TolB-like protein/class 3 adenylate cyclase
VEAPEPVERRLAAILAADVAGYSRLTGLDEEGTLARLRVLRRELVLPKIAEHRGRVVKTTGDGILIEFASVVDAVRCAVETQRAMAERNANTSADRRIELRIGINLGDVVVEEDGDLMGDGVNVAARLEALAEPGGVCVSRAAYEQIRGKIDVAFHDLGERSLKNIAERVRVYAAAPATEIAPTTAVAVSANRAPHLSIVVLPFANIGGDPEQEYFVDGVTESLTTDLSRITGSFVIGRNTAFTYKGKAVDARQIGRELNVRYVLEGSVQRSGNRLRVNVQLIDAESGNHLWAERFDKPLADLFDMQDEIVARLAGALNAQLIAAEARRAVRDPTPDSMDLYFQGMASFNKGFTPQHMTQARTFFERALALDPSNIEASVGMAWVDATTGGAFMTDDRSARLAAAEATLTNMLSLAPGHALAHQLLGVVKMHTNRAAEGIAELEQALALDRNMASAHAFIGLAKVFSFRGKETEAHVQEALRLSPRDTNAHIWTMIAGFGKLGRGTYDEAVARFRRAIEINRNNHLAYFCLAAALAGLGRLAEAQAEVQAGLALDPTFTVARFRAGRPSDNPGFVEQHEAACDCMRKAGVPEG